MRIPRPVKIWNPVDEFGLLVGLGRWSEDKKSLEAVRFPYETNKQLRERIRESMIHRGNSTLQGIVNNLNRDLGISPSGVGILSRYETADKKIFYLTETPHPGPSGIKVYVSSSGNWTESDRIYPQVRASGYSTATSGWIAWNQPDINPNDIQEGLAGSSGWASNRNMPFDTTIKYGDYSRILEFIGSDIPSTNYNIKVEYLVETGKDEYGSSQLNYRSDFSHPDDPGDESFTGLRTDVPTTTAGLSGFVGSGSIAVFEFNNIRTTPMSGYFYESDGSPTDKLIQIKQIVDEGYPLTWGRFKYDEGKWDQLERAAIGVIPSFHDETLPTGVAYAPTIVDGSRYGTDLDIVDISQSASGFKASWYPIFAPGEFYIQHQRFYMFAKKMNENLTLTAVGNLLSGSITSVSGDMPARLDPIFGLSSGAYATSYNNPYFARTHNHQVPASGYYYKASFIDDGSGEHASGTIDYDDGYAFYYDYDNGIVWASGIDPKFTLVWEHRYTAISGLFLTYSGGYGYTEVDLNPLNDPFDKVYYINV
jgi:hypothetical protein